MVNTFVTSQQKYANKFPKSLQILQELYFKMESLERLLLVNPSAAQLTRLTLGSVAHKIQLNIYLTTKTLELICSSLSKKALVFPCKFVMA